MGSEMCIRDRGASMTTKISMLAIDLAKGSFQVCAVGPDGAVLYNRVLSRTRMTALLAEQPACVVAMEACATSHHWGRVAQGYGHEVRLVPAAYVKPFVKRQKNYRADAEAIAEAASRPTMRFVAVKSVETQGRAVAFRTHQCLVRQRTQFINALRGHVNGGGKPSHVAAQCTATSGIGHGRWEMARALARALSG